jgi:hypothetical protein
MSQALGVMLKLLMESTLEARYRSTCSAKPSAKRWSINPAGKPSEDGCRIESMNTFFKTASLPCCRAS